MAGAHQAAIQISKSKRASGMIAGCSSQPVKKPRVASEGSQALRLYIENQRHARWFSRFSVRKSFLDTNERPGGWLCHRTREVLAPTNESKCLHLPSVASAGLVPVMAERPVSECNNSKKCLMHFFDTLKRASGMIAGCSSFPVVGSTDSFLYSPLMPGPAPPGNGRCPSHRDGCRRFAACRSACPRR